MSSSNFENFRPKLRTGRVIPQGSRIIFETDDPYNQIVLPMGLADVVLLCSGQFSVREIIEKIYRKQGAVPFRSILQAMHLLHQGGFFENGEELTINTHLHSWMDPKHGQRWRLSWRFGQRIVADRRSPMAYYGVTLAVLVGAILGLQMFPGAPLQLIEHWLEGKDFFNGLLKFLICSSLVQSARHLLRGIQLLLLTGKAYNVSIRLSPWGLHLHVGDETNDLFESRLYTIMFHLSQIFMGWFFIFCISPILTPESLDTMLILNAVMTFWETNPFVNSDGLKLLQAIMIQKDGSIASWHLESSMLIKSLNETSFQRGKDFSFICSTWGMIWLLGMFTALHESAIVFGPAALNQLTHPSWNAFAPLIALVVWMMALYYVVQSFIETIFVSAVKPVSWRVWQRLSSTFKHNETVYTKEQLVEAIQNLPLFSHFPDANLLKILDQSSVLNFTEDSYIVMQGDPSRDLFVLLEGEVEILRNASGKAEWVTELSAVSIFGEASLIDDQAPRQAQVRTKTKCAVLRVPVAFIRQVAEESHVIRHVEDFRNAILVNQFFASSPVFRSLSPASVEFLCSRGSLEYFDQNQVVFNQGDQGDSVFMILRGSVEIEVHGTTIKRLLQGNFFGEIALLANLPRTATVICCEPCVFFKISTDSFWEVLVQHIDLGVFLETVSENRLMEDLKVVQPTLKRTGTDSN